MEEIMYLMLRTYHPEATISTLLDPLGNHICFFLGRPWLNNQHNSLKWPENDSSCIPEAVYNIARYDSPTKGDVFLVNNVQDRSYIEWHSANFVEQLLGCEVPCDKILENIKYEGKIHRYWANNSHNTLEMLLKKLPQSFLVDIRKG
jgi:hypothetical protein